MASLQDIREEQIHMTRLRVLVDLTMYRLQHEALSREQALSLIERTRCEVLRLCPGKDEVFELVLRPRFQRILNERARVEWGIADSVN
ncbi:MAG: hypothetical protein ACE5MM_08130 [Nitrospiraceae bacterium]